MVARESTRRCAHPWSRLISKRSTWNRSKMTTGSANFEGSSERKISPEALVKSEIASATWLLVGGLLPAAMALLCGGSKVLLSAAGAGSAAAGLLTTFVRSETVFGGRFALEATTGDCSSTSVAVSLVFFEFAARGAAGARTAVSISAFSTLYR